MQDARDTGQFHENFECTWDAAQPMIEFPKAIETLNHGEGRDMVVALPLVAAIKSVSYSVRRR
jgi:hypothetical protein